MEYRVLGRTGLKVSPLCLGTMTFGRETDGAESLRILDLCLEKGINFIDTADVYARGRSEEILGDALKGRRDRIVLATKGRFRTGDGPNDMGLSRKHLYDALHASLRRLRTDYIDLYQIHMWHEETALDLVLSTLNDFVRQGKARHVGASNLAAWHLAQALSRSEQRGWERLECLQPQYSLLCRDIEREILPLCRFEALGVIAWSPLAGGVLSGKYSATGEGPQDARWSRKQELETFSERNGKIVDVLKSEAEGRKATPSQVALSWVMAQPGVTSAILGARTLEQAKENLYSPDVKLDADGLARLDEASAIPMGYPYEQLATWGRG
ncbi:MAG: aldo/keto reductase [Nitrospirae bacterium]|nr:aldo/keto reductase [Nitrospirota bacterium]